MLCSGKFNAFLHNGLWTEAANTTMLIKNNLLMLSRTLSPFQQFFGKEKRSTLSLIQTIGEMCITTYRENTNWAKLAHSGAPGILVGYTDGHPIGTYQVFNLKTKTILLT